MLLAIDVGNTNVTIGVFDGDRLAQSWRLATLRERTADELGILVTRLFEQVYVAPIDAIAVASVVPPLTRHDGEMCERYFHHTRAGRRPRPTPACRCSHPPARDVGADRIVNAVAAYDKYGRASAAPVIVVDFGTGTTFDVISAAWRVPGRRHLPGHQISAEALFQRAARLPRVEVRKPLAVIGQNTVDAVGTVLRVHGDGRRTGAAHAGELDSRDRAVVIATGGWPR